MINKGKRNIIGVLVDVVDYEAVLDCIRGAVRERRPLAISALAVHGVMTGSTNPEHRARLNALDMVVPDGQPVRWALNALHGTALRSRVYGPELMLRTLELAERERLGIYLYGSTASLLDRLQDRLRDRLPGLDIRGAEPSRFRCLTPAEKEELVARIRASGAQIVFVGLGCPRQEVWAYEYRDSLSMPILAVGAAFDFHAGAVAQAPPWMQDRGLEWAYRFKTEPRRLWRRYLILNPWYVARVACQRLGLRQYPTHVPSTPREISYG